MISCFKVIEVTWTSARLRSRVFRLYAFARQSASHELRSVRRCCRAGASILTLRERNRFWFRLGSRYGSGSGSDATARGSV